MINKKHQQPETYEQAKQSLTAELRCAEYFHGLSVRLNFSLTAERLKNLAVPRLCTIRAFYA